MTPRDLINSPTVKLLSYAVALTVAWMSLAAKIDALARDVATLKAVICEQAAKDSFCRRQP